MKPKKIPAREIRALIEEEIKLYTEYHKCSLEERAFITKFNAEKILELSDKRAALLEQMRQIRDIRVAFVKEMTGNEKQKLSTAISLYYSPQEAKSLIKATDKLRSIMQKTHQSGVESGGIVQFGMNMVNGLYSLFLSATQNVTRGYNSKGTIKESYHPAGHRNSNVLKEA